MAAIKPGMIVYVKTTDEPCFVLNINEKAPDPAGRYAHFSGMTVQVKRPLITDNGLQYVEDNFLFEELAIKDRATRMYDDMVEANAEAQALQGTPSVSH